MNNHINTDYWMSIVETISKASTCRVKIGTIIVQKQTIVATGYVGSVSGDIHCEDFGCLFIENNGLKGSGNSKYSCERTIHAELNAVLKCEKRGNKKDGWLKAYMTYCPCVNCLKAMLAIGVRYIVYKLDYKDVIRNKYFMAMADSLFDHISFTKWE